jgi:hypothetical protein
LVAARSYTPVAVLVNTTVTLGITAPDESTTVPRTLLLLDCDQAGIASNANRINASTPA